MFPSAELKLFRVTVGLTLQLQLAIPRVFVILVPSSADKILTLPFVSHKNHEQRKINLGLRLITGAESKPSAAAAAAPLTNRADLAVVADNASRHNGR